MSVYPGAIPSSGDLPDAGANLSSNPHSSLHDDVRDEVIAIATELGVEPSGTEATVRARLDQGLGLREIVTFTNDGTFTKASYPWLRAVRVRAVGAGGGGGGATTTGSGQVSVGSGGSAGGYSESFIEASALPSTVSVTVPGGSAGGTGGTGVTGTPSLFGSLVTTVGGGGGFARPATSPPTLFVPAPPSVAGTGQIASGGGSGDFGWANATGVVGGGGGGASYFGGGGNGANFAGDGFAGTAFGSGGGGAGNAQNQSTQRTGGAGAAGIVIVELYA